LYRGVLAWERELWEPALADFNQALELRPHLLAAYYYRGQLEAQQGQEDEALKDWRRVLRLEISSAEDYVYRAMARLALDDRKGATTDLNTALWLNPNLAKAYGLRGRMSVEAKDWEAAVLDLNYGLWLCPGEVELYPLRAQAVANQGDPGAALTDILHWQAFSPDSERGYYYRSALQAWLGHEAEAEAELETLGSRLGVALAEPEESSAGGVSPSGPEASSPATPAPQLSRFAQVQSSGSTVTDAEATANAEADVPAEDCPQEPGIPLALALYQQRGQVREILGDLAGAVADWSRVLEAVPEAATVLMERGRVLRDLGDREAATRDLQRAADLFQPWDDLDREREVWEILGLGDEWQ
ncbi:MAG: hypothetical protein ACO4AI_11060, partial [Prochlorothrix sp.]